MNETNIQSKQPYRAKYKVAKDESKISPNLYLLQREFNVDAPNKIWCGNATYI